jgi:integrase
VAVLMFAGLRVTEACRLRWRDVNLPAKRLTVRQSKTDAGMREVDLLPILQDVMLDHRAKTFTGDQDAPVFTTARGRTRGGQPRDKDNVNARVIRPVVERAGELLAERDLPPLPDGLSAHKLRHTFASVLVACGDDPAVVMAQIGHADPRFTLRVYTHLMRRGEDREQLRDLVGRGGLGTSAQTIHPVPTPVGADVPLG